MRALFAQDVRAGRAFPGACGAADSIADLALAPLLLLLRDLAATISRRERLIICFVIRLFEAALFLRRFDALGVVLFVVGGAAILPTQITMLERVFLCTSVAQV